MARRAQEINAERLGARIDVENPDDELGLLAKAFNETLVRLERSFEQLKRFTSDASHELRTPLTAIRSVGEVGLQKDGDRSHYREVIGSMLEETERLSRLVESLLAISRADAGQIRLQYTTIALLPLVRGAMSFLEVLAEEKRQTMSLEGDESIQVKADSVILRQVVINILDNAIKYSPPEGLVSVLVSRTDSLNACLEIKDSGPGIAAEHQSKVFDRFYRVDEGRSRDAGGAGLGLAITKWGAEAHGGSLQLDSASNGSTFRLLLPVVTNDEGRARKEATPGSGPMSQESHLALERRPS
jgi:heavy metal sensor kinase